MLKKILLISFLILFSLKGKADFLAGEEAFKNRRYTEAFNKFLPEAQKGDYRSQYYVGYLYLYGLGVNQDEDLALKYIKQSADQKYDTALALLGYLYDEGRLVPVDKKKAINLYKMAAEQGNTSALLNLGLAYYKGDGILKNDQKAVEMLEKVPLDQQPMVGRYLGEIYKNNKEFPNNYQRAIAAYSASAKAGDLGSFYALGEIYAMLDSGVTDKKKALEFYTYSASQGYLPAQYLLGIMYVNGDNGLDRDLYVGRAWLELAASQRYEPANSALAQLDEKMTLSEIETSKKESMRLRQEVLEKIESPYILEERRQAEEAQNHPTQTSKGIRHRRRR